MFFVSVTAAKLEMIGFVGKVVSILLLLFVLSTR